MNDVALSVDQSAKAVTTVATDASELVEAVVEIQSETNTNKKVVQDLAGVVNRFKKLQKNGPA